MDMAKTNNTVAGGGTGAAGGAHSGGGARSGGGTRSGSGRGSAAERNRESYEQMIEQGGLIPPQAIELEGAILGALMLERDSIIAVQEYLTADAFYKEAHRTIFRAIESLSAELSPIDLYTVTERLKQEGRLAEVGGATFLAELTQRVG
jgi:replicative DNA helicase